MLLTDNTSWMMQCRNSMYWYSSQQLSTVTSSGFSWLGHPAEGRPAGGPLSQPGPWSSHQERWEDIPRDKMSPSCKHTARHWLSDIKITS